MRVLGGMCLAWIALGSWTAVFPGSLEEMLGLEYDFVDTWGVSRAQFETFTIRTLVTLVLLAAIGYRFGRSVRNAPAVRPVDAELSPVATEKATT